jgi:hypothetical protein
MAIGDLRIGTYKIGRWFRSQGSSTLNGEGAEAQIGKT